MSFVATAIGGSAVLGMGGSIFGGIMGKKGADAQARQAATWTNSALNSINSAWGATNETTLPFRTMGEASMQRLLEAPVGGNQSFTQPYADLGNSSAKTLQALLMGGNVGQALQNSPMFQWQQEQGSRDINRELSARGMYGSGAGLEALSRFNAQLQAEEGDRLFNRLFGATQLGFDAAQVRVNQEQAGLGRLLGIGQIGANMAGQQAQHYQNIAIAQGNAKMGGGTQIGSAVNQGYQALGQMGQGITNSLSGALGQYGQYQMIQPLLSRLAPGGGSEPSYNTSAGKRYSFTGETGLEGLSNFS